MGLLDVSYQESVLIKICLYANQNFLQENSDFAQLPPSLGKIYTELPGFLLGRVLPILFSAWREKNRLLHVFQEPAELGGGRKG